MGTSASAVSRLMGKSNLDGNRWNSSQHESFFLWLLLLTLVQILMQHSGFGFFFGCSLFCCKPSQMAACRMTMQEDMRHDSIFQDCWFWLKMDYHSLFAQIKYRWVTWAAGNTFFPQKRKIISHLHHEHYSYKLGEGQRKERIKSKLFNIDETLLLKFDNLTVRLGSGFMKHQECLHVIFGFR